MKNKLWSWSGVSSAVLLQFAWRDWLKTRNISACTGGLDKSQPGTSQVQIQRVKSYTNFLGDSFLETWYSLSWSGYNGNRKFIIVFTKALSWRTRIQSTIVSTRLSDPAHIH